MERYDRGRFHRVIVQTIIRYDELMKEREYCNLKGELKEVKDLLGEVLRRRIIDVLTSEDEVKIERKTRRNL